MMRVSVLVSPKHSAWRLHSRFTINGTYALFTAITSTGPRDRSGGPNALKPPSFRDRRYLRQLESATAVASSHTHGGRVSLLSRRCPCGVTPDGCNAIARGGENAATKTRGKRSRHTTCQRPGHTHTDPKPNPGVAPSYDWLVAIEVSLKHGRGGGGLGHKPGDEVSAQLALAYIPHGGQHLLRALHAVRRHALLACGVLRAVRPPGVRARV